ncbi:wax ester/triacylglycerol synthase domain-containing protein, partial [Parvimonas micra]|uniref:wax ester/triacylglycerol synthase domain-containing protein n=1 Tax=Parvimonas micra TaxID=33033 RepID=UPI002B49B852
MTIAMSPIDAAFLRMETPRTPQHVAGLLEFRLPRGASRNFMRDLHAHARSEAQAAPPFNHRLAN